MGGTATRMFSALVSSAAFLFLILSIWPSGVLAFMHPDPVVRLRSQAFWPGIGTSSLRVHYAAAAAAVLMVIRWYTLRTPGDRHAALSASPRSNHDRTVPFRIT